MRIVIFKVNNLGDNVVFVPVVQELRRRCPDWHLTLLTTPTEAALYGGPLGPQRIITAGKKEFDRSYRRPWQLLRWILRVRRLRPDACLIAFDQGSAVHLVAKLSGAKVRIGGNLENIKVAGSVTTDVPMPADTRASSWNWETGRALVRALDRGEDWPERPREPDLRHLLPAVPTPRTSRRVVVVHPGASRKMNQWGVPHFAAVASLLAGDFEVRWIAHGPAPAEAPPGTQLARVGTLAELAATVADADLFLGNNSGPMHVANALGRPVVVVNGPSGYGWEPSWHPGTWDVLRHPNLYCAPCERPNKEMKVCANLAEPMACLRYWTPAKVEAACRARLDQPREARP